MKQETTQNNPAEILISTITKASPPIKKILERAKVEIQAEDVRFRLRDWQNQSVVYVPNWVIGEELEKLEEPELARRIYYDPNDDPTKPTQIDCIVGLVARIAFINEIKEKNEDDRSNELMEKLMDFDHEIDINNPQIRFNDVGKQKVYQNFIKKLKEQRNIYENGRDEWTKFFDDLKKLEDNKENVIKEIHGKNAPWRKEMDSKEKGRQWAQLQTYIEQHKKGSENEELLKAVKKTADRYSTRYDQWKDYISYAENVKCEIAVPVVAFGKFLGVLNFHKETKFSKKDEDRARIYATQLAAAYLQQQTEQFEVFQKVFQIITAESDFEIIASKIAEGIRKGLQDGLENEEVFPLLYVATSPINRFDKLTDNEFKDRWDKSYHHRKKPSQENNKDFESWKTEEKLGGISIRSNGLGWAVIEKWKEKSVTKSIENSHLFIVSRDVDNPNSKMGSRSALDQEIKTTGCLPLIFKDQVYGLLYLHCTKRHFFTEAEVHALETSSIQAAIAIKNAGSFGKSYEELYGVEILELLSMGE